MRRWAVIPTSSREKDYLEVVEWCKNHDVTTVTISTSEEADKYSVGKVIKNRELNISKWWNLGLDYIAEQEFETEEEYTVAVLNDDAIMPDDWFEKLERYISDGFSGASGYRFGTRLQISGYAFLLNGRHDIRADEELVWWFGDDSVARRCEEEGGFAYVSGIEVGNKYANSTSEVFSEQIAKDRERYFEKYKTL